MHQVKVSQMSPLAILRESLHGGNRRSLPGNHVYGLGVSRQVDQGEGRRRATRPDRCCARMHCELRLPFSGRGM
jgi:hypothetical protein